MLTNLEIMKTELKKSVIAPLLEQGFAGKWPHFRRVHASYIELLTFQLNKYGGSFTVELSAVFPNRNEKNYTDRADLALEKINVWDTNRRYRLPGMYNGWFYYRDLYKKHSIFWGTEYLDVSEKESDTFSPPRGYKLVQRFTPNTAETICSCVNLQLKSGFAWLEQYIRKSLKS